MSLKEEQLSAIKAVYEGRRNDVDVRRASGTKIFRLLWNRGVGTAAAAVAMAAAHSRPQKRAGQLYSINAHAQVYYFPAGLESSSIWTRPVFQ